MSDLADFLLARIAEDEALASAVGPEPVVRTSDTAVTRFLEVWHADRVLAECEAKRQIVDVYLDERSRRDVYQRDDAMAVEDDEQAQRRRASAARCRGLEFAVEQLALPYAHHPGYQAEWTDAKGADRARIAPTASKPSRHCPECGAGQIDVHARSCTSKARPPLSSGAVPYGGACDMPGCRYADRNVRHVHPPGGVNQ